MTSNEPGNRSFFKYASPRTALSILESKNVRYSSPLTFNDPFDLQSGLHFDFDISTLHERVLDKLQQFAASPTVPPIDESDPWGEIVKLVRDHYPTHGFPRDRFRQLTGDLFASLVEAIELTRKQYQDQWYTLLPGIRVFCVSEKRDDLLMWAHYAKDHTGAVFEFLSLPKEDNPLSIARSIVYVNNPPAFFTENEWLDDILSVRELDIDGLYKRYAYYKSSHWIYEREWRVWYPTIPPSDGLYEDVPIRQSEFASLYIGCRSEPDFTARAISLTRSAFPNARIYKAKKREGVYGLEYTEI